MDTAKGRLKTGVVKPVTVRLRDSITFTLSVTSMLLTAYFMGAYPGWMVPWYSVWLFGLLCLRFVVYYCVGLKSAGPNWTFVCIMALWTLVRT